MTIEEFNEQVKTGLVIVKFSTTWCGPCKTVEATLDRIKQNVDGVEIVKIDAEDEPELALHFRIRSVPVLMYYKDGELKDKSVGAVSEETIRKTIENVKNN